MHYKVKTKFCFKKLNILLVYVTEYERMHAVLRKIILYSATYTII